MSLFSTPMLVLLFVLVFPTTISYLLLPLGLKYLKTTLVAIYGYLILIVATVTSFILGQDRFSWTQLAAIVLICASVYLVEVAESNKQITSKIKIRQQIRSVKMKTIVLPGLLHTSLSVNSVDK